MKLVRRRAVLSRKCKSIRLNCIFSGVAKRKKNKKSTDEINSENEFLKLKMMAEFGGDFVGNEDIPPAVENQFLKQIMNFHKQHEQSKLVSVYKYIGEPEYNHVNDLGDKEIRKELRRLKKIMLKHRVGLDVLAPTPEREIYRFITEELFKQEIEDIKIKGWINQFIYEEFHPNADYDVKNAVHSVILSLFDARSNFLEDHFSEEMKDSLGLSTDPEELREKAKAFHSNFYDVVLVNYDFLTVEINKEEGTAYVHCDVTFKVQKEKGKRSKREVESVEFYLNKADFSNNWWEVNRVVSELF